MPLTRLLAPAGVLVGGTSRSMWEKTAPSRVSVKLPERKAGGRRRELHVRQIAGVPDPQRLPDNGDVRSGFEAGTVANLARLEIAGDPT